MIRASFDFDAQPLLDFERFADGFDRVVDTISTDVFKAIERPLLDDLRTYPARAAVLPFVWSRNKAANERARRYYFAVIAKSNPGGRYQRTGKYAQSWTVTLRKSGSVRTISAGSNYPAAKFIGGSFNRNRDFQIPGHKVTGWPQSAKTVDFWLNASQEETERQFDRVIASELGIRSSGRRNR